MSGRIILGDCLEVLPTIETGSVALVLCDLPYGTTQNKWDCLIDLTRLWPELERVTTTGAAFVFTAQQPFTTDLVNSNPKRFRYALVWEKSLAGGFLDANRKPLRVHEDILLFYRSLPTYNPQMVPGRRIVRKNRKGNSSKSHGAFGGSSMDSTERYPVSIIKIGNGHGVNSGHPTQKPVPLFEYLIRTYTNEGDTVLDPTAGSGTTAVACIKSNRNYICIERDPAFHAIAERRALDVHPDLFIPHE